MERKYNLTQSAQEHAVTLLPYSSVSSVDLRRFAPAVYNQLDLGACTGFAISSLREMIGRIHNAPTPELSPRNLYYWERVIEKDVPDDHGANIVDGMYVLYRRGVCEETLCPYTTLDIQDPHQLFTQPPTPAATANALQYKVAPPIRLSGLNGIQAALAQLRPVVVGMEVFSTLDAVPYNATPEQARVTLPAMPEQARGGHCVLVVGYDDAQNHLIVRNSWGNAWGDQGYFYLDYNYISAMWDFWTV